MNLRRVSCLRRILDSELRPGGKTNSSSFLYWENSRMPLLLIASMVKIVLTLEDAAKPLATFSSGVQLETDHQVISEPFGYWEPRSRPTPLYSWRSDVGRLSKALMSSARKGKYCMTFARFTARRAALSCL